MEKYKESIQNNSQVEMIHISRDRDKSAALDWAKQESFPWPTYLPGDTPDDIWNLKATFVPFYCLVDRDGNKLAEGSAACFKKIKELSGN
ncbi:TlpA family protein disulfide reductase [Persicirhabdus sediminis]|uniref:Uncharacterized protein n=1 Tax=Persicirhabdus sediminis TaxID=454144 RepID=A0A8J7MC52_9BACT|nr:hypothetical protein [Persicirhabdus sediminis]MBK1789883.1 hypothetical protein [Persicirhabdus sediminis]